MLRLFVRRWVHTTKLARCELIRAHPSTEGPVRFRISDSRSNPVPHKAPVPVISPGELLGLVDGVTGIASLFESLMIDAASEVLPCRCSRDLRVQRWRVLQWEAFAIASRALHDRWRCWHGRLLLHRLRHFHRRFIIAFIINRWTRLFGNHRLRRRWILLLMASNVTEDETTKLNTKWQ